jgi:two-component system, chemotaxis family, response regulator Rcp1
MKHVDILLVDDNPDDVEITTQALRESKIRIDSLTVVNDRAEALSFLRREGSFKRARRPSVILLDLKTPRHNAHQTLTDIKSEAQFRCIPILVLTREADEDDLMQSYTRHANCYIRKPSDIADLVQVVKAIDSFWFSVVAYPCKS